MAGSTGRLATCYLMVDNNFAGNLIGLRAKGARSDRIYAAPDQERGPLRRC